MEIERQVREITEALGAEAGARARELLEMIAAQEERERATQATRNATEATAQFRDAMRSIELGNFGAELARFADEVRDAQQELQLALAAGASPETVLREMTALAEAVPAMVSQMISEALSGVAGDPAAIQALRESISALLANLPAELEPVRAMLAAAFDDLGRLAQDAIAERAARIDERIAALTPGGEFTERVADMRSEFADLRMELEELISQARAAGTSTSDLEARLARLDDAQRSAGRAIELDFLGSLERLGVEVPGLAEAMIRLEFAQARAQAIALFATEARIVAANDEAQAVALASDAIVVARRAGLSTEVDIVRVASERTVLNFRRLGASMVDITKVAGERITELLAAAAAGKKPKGFDPTFNLPGFEGGGGLPSGSFEDVQIPGLDINLQQLLDLLDQGLAEALAALQQAGPGGGGPGPGGGHDPVSDLERQREELQRQIDTWMGLDLGPATRDAVALNQRFQELIPSAQELGMLDQLTAAFNVARQSFVDDILAPFAPGSELDRGLAAVNERFDDLRAAFLEIGASAEELARLEAGRQSEILDFWDGVLDPIRSLQDRLLGQPGAVSPEERLARRQAAFDELAQRALGGDVEAIRSLPGAVDQLLGDARQFLGSGQGFQAIFSQIQGVLDGVEGLAPVAPALAALPALSLDKPEKSAEVDRLVAELREDRQVARRGTAQTQELEMRVERLTETVARQADQLEDLAHEVRDLVGLLSTREAAA
jgi:hypothetical protein